MKGCVVHTTADSYSRMRDGGVKNRERKNDSKWEVRHRRAKGWQWRLEESETCSENA